MVGLATRASNNLISRPVIGSKGNNNSLGLQFREKNVDEGNRIYTYSAETISGH